MPETTPLLSSSGASGDYYFLNNSGGEGGSSREGAAGTLEAPPNGTDANEFAPKLLGPRRQVGVL